MAIQDQVLPMRVYQAKIMMINVPALICRLCSRCEETIQHLLASCSELAPSGNMNRHNMVARALHWHLCSTLLLLRVSIPMNLYQ